LFDWLAESKFKTDFRIEILPSRLARVQNLLRRCGMAARKIWLLELKLQLGVGVQ
jgi:hypothetical protein